MFYGLSRSRARVFGLRPSQVRFQSSITFSTNQNLVSKNRQNNDSSGNKKNVDSTSVDSNCMVGKSTRVGGENGLSDKRVAYKKARDYSWLPKVPQTPSITQRQITTSSLYSGYRPLFIDKKGTLLNDVNSSGQNANSFIYEFAMKLNEISEPSPWMMSATGLESYSEWDYVPSNVIKKLKPFELHDHKSGKYGNAKDYNPFSKTGNDKDYRKPNSIQLKEDLRKSKLDTLVKNTYKLMKRSKGRKKPIVKLLQMINNYRKKED